MNLRSSMSKRAHWIVLIAVGRIVAIALGIVAWASLASASSITSTYAFAAAGDCATDGSVTPTVGGGSTASVICGPAVNALSASADAIAFAINGHLGAGADGYAEVPTNPSIFPISQAFAGASASVDDVLTVTNPGLFLLEEFADGNASTDPCDPSGGNINNAVFAGVSLSTPLGVYGFDERSYASCTSGALSGTLIVSLDLAAGATLTLSAHVDAAVSDVANGFGQSGAVSMSSSSDISHSLFFYLTPITSGASYITASGNDYARPADTIPTPEPTSLVLMASGLAVGYEKMKKRMST